MKLALMFATLVVLVGCASEELAKPDLTARITQVHPTTIRVQGPMKRDAYIVDVSSAKIRIKGKDAKASDLKVGHDAEIVFDGPVKESFPMQVKAKTVVVP